MANLSFVASDRLPVNPEADTFYFIQDGENAEAYLTTSTGALRRIGNTALIEEKVHSGLAAFYNENLVYVSDITERNILGDDATRSIMAVVLDASADSAVGTGSALYFFDYAKQVWELLTVYGEMDITLSWDNIVNKPESTKTAIDSAVSRSHSHNNTSTLDDLAETPQGVLTFKGNPISSLKWVQEEW